MYELLAMMYDSDALGPGRAADAFRWYTAYPTDRYTAAGRYRLAQLYAQGLGTQPDAEKALDILKCWTRRKPRRCATASCKA